MSVRALRADRGVAADQPPWRCPDCGAPQLSALPTLLRCSQCERRFPSIAVADTRVHLLSPDPGATLAQWWARHNGFINQQQRLIRRNEQACRRLSPGNRRRRFIEAETAARRAHIRDVASLLAPLMECAEWPRAGDDISATLGALPQGLSLDGYLPNVLRDWAWGSNEPAAQLEALDDVLSARDIGDRLLTVGSGAGRLAWDLHLSAAPRTHVLLDINPLLSVIAARILGGETLSLYEFPQAGPAFRVAKRARTAANDGPRRQQCALPAGQATASKNRSLHHVCGDLMNAPFRDGGFDTVFTPWLIDVLPHDMALVLPHLNRLLGVGGSWISTGPWVPLHPAPEARYTEAELMALAAEFGFTLEASTHRRMPYLQSPTAAQRRSERVWSFRLRKVSESPVPPRSSLLPPWAEHLDRPIPAYKDIELVASQRLLEAQVLAALDGKRSLGELSALIAQEYELPLEAAKLAVRRIVLNAQQGLE